MFEIAHMIGHGTTWEGVAAIDAGGFVVWYMALRYIALRCIIVLHHVGGFVVWPARRRRCRA